MGRQTLKDAKIYNVVYESPFYHDCNTNTMQSFCEAWFPTINTLLTSVGELSIPIWDLHVICGLPISGFLYEEVVPNVEDLTRTFENGKRFLPQSCEHIFDAFHQLQTENQEVAMER